MRRSKNPENSIVRFGQKSGVAVKESDATGSDETDPTRGPAPAIGCWNCPSSTVASRPKVPSRVPVDYSLRSSVRKPSSRMP